MTPALLELLLQIVASAPQIATAVGAIVKMSNGTALTDEDRLALGAAMEAAHARVQAS